MTKISTTQQTTNQQQLTSHITIHNMEPVGCWNWCDPLHRTLTVANPKSPIFTVRLSVRKMSIKGARLKKHKPVLKSFIPTYAQMKCEAA